MIRRGFFLLYLYCTLIVIKSRVKGHHKITTSHWTCWKTLVFWITELAQCVINENRLGRHMISKVDKHKSAVDPWRLWTCRSVRCHLLSKRQYLKRVILLFTSHLFKHEATLSGCKMPFLTFNAYRQNEQLGACRQETMELLFKLVRQ